MKKEQVRIQKTCNCCQAEYQSIPKNARFDPPDEAEDWEGGFYWECNCKSTLFIPFYMLINLAIEQGLSLAKSHIID